MGSEDEMDAISNKAFAYGYFGGGVLLVAHLGLQTTNRRWLTYNDHSGEKELTAILNELIEEKEAVKHLLI